VTKTVSKTITKITLHSGRLSLSVCPHGTVVSIPHDESKTLQNHKIYTWWSWLALWKELFLAQLGRNPISLITRGCTRLCEGRKSPSSWDDDPSRTCKSQWQKVSKHTYCFLFSAWVPRLFTDWFWVHEVKGQGQGWAGGRSCLYFVTGLCAFRA